jgi:hypothetical protein
MTSRLRGDALPRIVSSHHDPVHAEQGASPALGIRFNT